MPVLPRQTVWWINRPNIWTSCYKTCVKVKTQTNAIPCTSYVMSLKSSRSHHTGTLTSWDGRCLWISNAHTWWVEAVVWRQRWLSECVSEDVVWVHENANVRKRWSGHFPERSHASPPGKSPGASQRARGRSIQAPPLAWTFLFRLFPTRLTQTISCHISGKCADPILRTVFTVELMSDNTWGVDDNISSNL